MDTLPYLREIFFPDIDANLVQFLLYKLPVLLSHLGRETTLQTLNLGNLYVQDLIFSLLHDPLDGQQIIPKRLPVQVAYRVLGAQNDMPCSATLRAWSH